MKSLLDKNLIRIAGRKKTPGRPIVYGTTRQFLEHFGLKSLEDLPKIEELNSPEIKKQLAGDNAEVELIPESAKNYPVEQEERTKVDGP
jgi:segregation and condensation protein B